LGSDGVVAGLLLFFLQAAAAAAPAACEPSAELRFICGAERPEDVARVPETRWLVFSGFSDGAGLKLVDTAAFKMRRWYSGAPGQLRHDRDAFPLCPSPPAVESFNAQGISLRTIAPQLHRLYVVNHGGRESIEVFSIDARSDEPKLHWLGCVLMPEGIAANSVATYSDGTILASVLTHPGTFITDFVRGGVTGGVYEWRPGSQAFKLLPGTELPGNNGIETAPDDQEFYVEPWRQASCPITFTGIRGGCCLPACSTTSLLAAARARSFKVAPTGCAAIGDTPSRSSIPRQWITGSSLIRDPIRSSTECQRQSWSAAICGSRPIKLTVWRCELWTTSWTSKPRVEDSPKQDAS
jgi:hypothetical protein